VICAVAGVFAAFAVCEKAKGEAKSTTRSSSHDFFMFARVPFCGTREIEESRKAGVEIIPCRPARRHATLRFHGGHMAADLGLAAGGETIELQQQVARLQALLEASRQVHSTIREEEVLESVLRIVVRELEMAGAAFSGTSLAYGDITNDAATTNGQVQLVFPLADREGNTMTELLVASPGGRELTLYEADFLDGLALQAAVALENARNHKRNVEFARMHQDLEAARRIQRSLLPQTLPDIPAYSLAFRSDACYEVG